MKHIVKVNDIQEAKDSDIRPIIALDNSGILFFEKKRCMGYILHDNNVEMIKLSESGRFPIALALQFFYYFDN